MCVFPRSLAPALASLALAAPAGAVTLTFDSLPQGPGLFPATIIEQGVTISADPASDGLLWEINPGTIHLDDGGTANTAWVTFATGGIFSARSMDAIGLSMASFVDDGEEVTPVPYDNVLVQGFLNGAEVAAARYSTGLAGGPAAFAFGAGFAGIDLLRISAVTSAGQDWQGLPIQCGDAPCGHFEIDAVTLAPVPLPAALPALLAGLGALAAIGRRGLSRPPAG